MKTLRQAKIGETVKVVKLHGEARLCTHMNSLNKYIE